MHHFRTSRPAEPATTDEAAPGNTTDPKPLATFDDALVASIVEYLARPADDPARHPVRQQAILLWIAGLTGEIGRYWAAWVLVTGHRTIVGVAVAVWALTVNRVLCALKRRHWATVSPRRRVLLRLADEGLWATTCVGLTAVTWPSSHLVGSALAVSALAETVARYGLRQMGVTAAALAKRPTTETS